MLCFDVHHGKFCRRLFERCFECHVPAQEKNDHAMNCGVRNWYQSQKYVDMYVKIPVVRATISFEKPIQYVLHGSFVEAKAGTELFSGMADILFKFESQSVIAIATTGFTRVRVPIMVRDNNGLYTERMVFLTSQDRTIVAANSSRVVNQSNILQNVEHNTPLVLFLSEGCVKLSVDVASGGKVHNFNIGVTTTADGQKFQIPDDLNVKTHRFVPKAFDADFSSKKLKRP